nr:MAG TPA: hypothetical protein [Crassvirales sp.]
MIRSEMNRRIGIWRKFFLEIFFFNEIEDLNGKNNFRIFFYFFTYSRTSPAKPDLPSAVGFVGPSR